MKAAEKFEKYAFEHCECWIETTLFIDHVESYALFVWHFLIVWQWLLKCYDVIILIWLLQVYYVDDFINIFPSIH